MAIRIVDVKLTTGYTWQNVRNKPDWNSVKNTNKDWQELLQTSVPGGAIKIEVEVSENNWQSIKDNNLSWQRIKEKFASWLDIKNY